MNDDLTPELEAEPKQLFAEEARDSSEVESPSPQDIEKLALGQHDETTGDALLAQVALNPDLTDELIELRRLAADATHDVHPPAESSGVNAVMATIASQGQRPIARRPRRPVDRRTARTRRFVLAAACLVLASSLASIVLWRENADLWRENADLRQELTMLEAPSLEAPSREASKGESATPGAASETRAGARLIDLFADARLRGPGEPADVTRASPGDVLILTPAEPVPQLVYDVRMQLGTDEIWRGRATAEDSGAVVLVLGALPTGALRIELRPETGAAASDVTVYPLEVEPPP